MKDIEPTWLEKLLFIVILAVVMVVVFKASRGLLFGALEICK